jgi:diacylglycerol O-acyltransferase / wax synthase
MKKIPLGLQDAQMLLGDSPNTPMHVGGFNVYRLPEGAPDDFVRHLVQQFRAQAIASPPWTYRLAKQGALASKLAPAWEITTDESLDYHLAHHALPAPGGERELGELLSRLHSQPLDMTRPLWEWHVIEGYANRRFVIYQKIHHALFDGSTGMKAFSAMNAERPDAPVRTPWAASDTAPREKGRDAEPARRDLLAGFQNRLQKSLGFYLSMPGVVRATTRTVRAAMGDGSGLVAPYTGPKSIINSPVTRRRRISTQMLDFARTKALSKATDCTLNDVLLAVCGAALRRYLQELGALPRKPLTAGVPVALKHEEGAKSGNKVSLMFATLGTDIGDPFERVMAIRSSTRAAKEHLMQLTDASRDTYGILMVLPAVAGGVVGGGRVMCNVPVSNIPGPRTRLYLAGAPLEAAYPTSVLIGVSALGITCVSYDQGLFLGIITCPDVLPHGQRLAVYVGEAFEELETAVAREAAGRREEAAPAADRVQAPSARKSRTRRRRSAGVAASTKKRVAQPAKKPPRTRSGSSAAKARGTPRRRPTARRGTRTRRS